MTDDVLLDEVLQVALVDLVEHRRSEREHVTRERVHLLGGLDPGRPRSHQRLVDIQMEQAHLGIGDLGHRLAIYPDQLQQSHEREARIEHRGDVAQHLKLVLRHRARSARGGAQAR